MFVTFLQLPATYPLKDEQRNLKPHPSGNRAAAPPQTLIEPAAARAARKDV